MTTVLITGANGFIGKNLIATLNNDIQILKYDIDNSLEELKEFTRRADFVFHLAGVNRPLDTSEFEKGNKGFTELLLQFLKYNPKKVPVLMTSSIQAELDNPYGQSKKSAELSVQEYSKETGASVYIYRLPNVFGKWCRPNYNSVVATWCYNVSHGLPIQINNPDTELNLVYVDDVIQEFINAFNGSESRSEDDYCFVPRTFSATLKQVADTLNAFRESRNTLIIPSFKGEFERFLYATYLSYLPENKFGYELEMKHDQRGWLAEFIKSPSIGQLFISRTKPGITRGNHWHHTKVEKFLVIEGEAVIRFRKIDAKEIIEYRVSGDKLEVLDIPTGYTHSIENVGNTDVITLFWADEIFNPDKPDTYYLEV
ncbi:NAD-dependent epimerase/dehydratase family protein [Dehalobacter sp. TeCB1]|uniref:polysaccharide biosynthesis C-terminal domain-containing protein n=1 Tax=Dehalobacter sp. TeCB1 TaxID=1843715 RepID=UPI00083A961B|nr:NAD-dependent epimerase/dehydratase family protein [Dehalobacter sp. TeCB1]OCZ49433.1 capsular biosynthesis protein [Dehalobacter sp. TeCB1]